MPKRVNKYKSLPESERALIDEFVESLRIRSGPRKGQPLSEGRKKKYRIDLGQIIFEIDKPILDILKVDLETYIQRKKKRDNGNELTEWSKYGIRVAIHAFFDWLKGDDFVDWIVLGKVNNTLDASRLLDDKEKERAILAAQTVQEKAFITTVFELGVMLMEFLSLKRSSVRFDKYGALVDIPASKHLARSIRVIDCVPFLANWIENHRHKDKDAPLWVDESPNGSNKGYPAQKKKVRLAN